MATTPDEVKRRLVPREYGPYTTMLIAALEAGQHGDEVSYGALTALCRRDVTQGPGASNLRSARRYVEREKGLVWVAVWGQGKLRCIGDSDKVITAERMRTAILRKAHRQLIRLRAVDVTVLDEDQRRHHGQLVTGAGIVAAFTDARTQKALPAPDGRLGQVDTHKLIEAMKEG